MRLKLIAGILISIMLFITLIGCSVIKQEENAINTKEFVDKQSNPDEIIKFINTNIDSMSEEDITTIILALESAQEKTLPKFEQEVSVEIIQKTLSQGKTEVIQEILNNILNNGYKIETAEGMYYPVIDYPKYKQWSGRASKDIAEYVEIMSEESDVPPAKDGALVIDWDKIVKRALNQEKFINNYQQSVKSEAIKELYKKYKLFIFYGLNNTPLFEYNKKTMNPDAKKVYQSIAEIKDSNSELVNQIKEFMNYAKYSYFKENKKLNELRSKYTQRED